MTIKIMTVRQPWAWAIIHGGKDVENRSRNIAGEWRGTVAIHAGLAYDHDAIVYGVGGRPLEVDPEGDQRGNGGAILGVVDLVDVHYLPTWSELWSLEIQRDVTCSPWAERGPVNHLILANPRPLPEPIPYKGALGLRTLPDDIEALIRAQITR